MAFGNGFDTGKTPIPQGTGYRIPIMPWTPARKSMVNQTPSGNAPVMDGGVTTADGVIATPGGAVVTGTTTTLPFPMPSQGVAQPIPAPPASGGVTGWWGGLSNGEKVAVAGAGVAGLLGVVWLLRRK